MELDEAITNANDTAAYLERLKEGVGGILDAEHVVPFAQTLRALVAAAEAERWRPIETAPKDGTEILIVDRVGMCVAKWAEYCGWISYTDDGWYEACVWPTHWRPLPPAPEA